MIYVRPWSGAWKFGKAIADGVNGRMLSTRDRNYPFISSQDLVINYGSAVPFYTHAYVLNIPSNIVNKLEAFDLLGCDGIPCPEHTFDKTLAQAWLKKGPVLGRDTANGCRGRGITVYDSDVEMKDHFYYTPLFPATREFRVHVILGGDEPRVFTQEKLRRKGQSVLSEYIKNHANGYVFCFKHLSEQNPVPLDVINNAVLATKSLGMDFAAVDIGYTKDGTCVYELNSAPGIEGTALNFYVDSFRRIYDNG